MQIKQQDSLFVAVVGYLILPLLQAKVIYHGYNWFAFNYTNVAIDYWHVVGITYIAMFIKSSYRFSEDGKLISGNAALRHVAYKYLMTILALKFAWLINMFLQ